MSEIPQWAVERACVLANAAGDGVVVHWTPEQAKQQIEVVNLAPAMKAFARYIAEHEEPPVDPLQAAIADAYDDVWAGQPGLPREDIIHGLTEGLRKRGIELGKAQS